MAKLNNLCGSCGDCCVQRPRLSVGVVYPNGVVELADSNELTKYFGIQNLCGSCYAPSCAPSCGPCSVPCSSSCCSCAGGSCRPRLSVGVVYPNGENIDHAQLLGINNLCGSVGPCNPCNNSCRPKLSVGVVYSNDANSKN